MSDVLVALTHFKRTANLAKQLAAFARQTHPVDIAIVDNGPISLFETRTYCGSRKRELACVSEIYSMRRNHGPSCRFIAPMLDLDHKFTLLYDDDCLPERGAIEHIVSEAERLANEFSELGVVGRNFAEDEAGSLKYQRRDVQRSESEQSVGMICRSHFFKTSLVNGVFDLRRKLARIGVDPREVERHDDMLCLGMTTQQLRPTLLGVEPDGCKLIGEELPDDFALHRTEGFMQSRNAMLSELQRHGVIR